MTINIRYDTKAILGLILNDIKKRYPNFANHPIKHDFGIKPSFCSEEITKVFYQAEFEVVEEKTVCSLCKGEGTVQYYHDAGDHFSAGPAPNSGYRWRNCPKCGDGKYL